MKPAQECTAEDIISPDILDEIFAEEDIITQARLILEYQERARELKVKLKFDKMVAAYEKAYKEIAKERKEKEAEERANILRGSVNGFTNFTLPEDAEFSNIHCGAWIADDNGIYSPISNPPYEIRACYHSILPIRRLINAETGEEKLVIAFKRNYIWKTIVIQKDIVCSASKIVQLSNLGVCVNSENARALVKYLTDVESLNDDFIGITQSTSKLGWHNEDFLPFDSDKIVFDGDQRFRTLFQSIHERGSEKAWMDHVKELRATGRLEIKIMLAASFSSILLKPLSVLPYFVDLWGETEGGKSVSLMLAASVWGCPEEGQYIGDFKTTDAGLEAKADVLNSLPVMLDDTSKTSSRMRDNFEGIVYDLCSGKGKTRSNKALGINRENYWKTCFLTNGEKPLMSYVEQGGAINRILEVECGEKVYSNPQKTANLLKANYGFAGRKFVNVIKSLDVAELNRMHNDFMKKLLDSTKMQKQSMSLAVILVADALIDDYIFQDGCRIDIDEAKELLANKDDISDNSRCYEYLTSIIAQNASRFDNSPIEQWGIKDKEYVIFYPQAFKDILSAQHFSWKSFLKWADKEGHLNTDGKNFTKLKKINGIVIRAIWLRVENQNEDFSTEISTTDIPFCPKR